MSDPVWLLAIDVGTTGVNAIVFDTCGNALGSAYREYPSLYPESHHVEQDAAELVTQTFAVCRELFDGGKLDPHRIAAVGVTSQRATFGLLDARGELIGGRFIGWQDNRAACVLEEMTKQIDATELYRISGMPLTPTYTLEKLVWFQKFRQEVFRKTATVIFPGDYLLSQLGGSLCTEVTSACCSGMMDVHALDWSSSILDAFGLSRSLFAPLVRPGTVVGQVSTAVSAVTGLLPGTPLVATSGDQQCAAVGAGVIDVGRASLTLGTAGLLVVATDGIDLAKSPGLMVPSSGKVGLYEVEGIQLGAAACYRWARDIFGLPEKMASSQTGEDAYVLMERLLDDSEPGARGVTFLPFLSGAGYPLWNPELSGGFSGLRFSHTRGDLLRAVIEGVAFESHDMYRQMEASGVQITSLTLTGGATASPIWCQTIADVFNLTVRPLEVPNATLVAAAIFAGIGVGAISDVDRGVAQMVRWKEPIVPMADNVERLRPCIDRYREQSRASSF